MSYIFSLTSLVFVLELPFLIDTHNLLEYCVEVLIFTYIYKNHTYLEVLYKRTFHFRVTII